MYVCIYVCMYKLLGRSECLQRSSLIMLYYYIYTHTHTHTGTYDIKSNIICIFFQTARVVVLWESINEKTDLHRRNFYRRSRHPGVAFFLKKECSEGADI